MSRIWIDLDQIGELVAKSDAIFISQEGEQNLTKLLKIQQKVEQAIKDAKLKLEETALKLDPNFSSIRGDRVQISYRSYGARYQLDSSLVDQIEPELVKKKISYSLKTKELEKWLKTKPGLPLGVKEVERTKQISIKLAKEENA